MATDHKPVVVLIPGMGNNARIWTDQVSELSGDYEVIVADTGFVWEGRTHKSLSAVAQAITGAKWNGRRFFGLTKEQERSHA